MCKGVRRCESRIVSGLIEGKAANNASTIKSLKVLQDRSSDSCSSRLPSFADFFLHASSRVVSAGVVRNICRSRSVRRLCWHNFFTRPQDFPSMLQTFEFNIASYFYCFRRSKCPKFSLFGLTENGNPFSSSKIICIYIRCWTLPFQNVNKTILGFRIAGIFLFPNSADCIHAECNSDTKSLQIVFIYCLVNDDLFWNSWY